MPSCFRPNAPYAVSRFHCPDQLALRRAVVLCVVDVSDFDGSLPRLALQTLLPRGTGDQLPQDFGFKLMIAVNKFDTLPVQATPTRVEQWVRIRLRQAGLPRPDKVSSVARKRCYDS